MTPCEKLGYKVGDEFVFSPKDGHHGFRDGEIVELIKDDNSIAPWFKCGERQHCAWLRDVKPINKQEKPIPQQHLADQLEAALAALDSAQSEVDRMQAEYRARIRRFMGRWYRVRICRLRSGR